MKLVRPFSTGLKSRFSTRFSLLCVNSAFTPWSIDSAGLHHPCFALLWSKHETQVNTQILLWEVMTHWRYTIRWWRVNKEGIWDAIYKGRFITDTVRVSGGDTLISVKAAQWSFEAEKACLPVMKLQVFSLPVRQRFLDQNQASKLPF